MTPTNAAPGGQPPACAHALAPVPALPAGAPGWMVAWAERTRADIQLLADHGALPHAAAAGRVLVSLIECAREWLDEEVATAEAARATRRSAETVRRAVRDGRVEGRRASEGGHIRIRRGDLGALRKEYDPAADALAIAARRRSR